MVIGRTGLRVLFVLAVMVGFYLMFMVAPAWAQGNQGGDLVTPGPNRECPGAEVVTSIDSATNDQREAFEVSGQSFRVSYQVGEFDDPDAFNDFTIEITDEFGLVESDSIQESGTRRFTVPDGPGSFEVETDVEPDDGAEYEVVVEDCVGDSADDNQDDNDDVVSGGQNNGSDNNDNNGSDNNGSDNNDNDDVIDNTIPNKPLPNTGGATPAFLMSVLTNGVAFLALLSLGAVSFVAWKRKSQVR